jgi:hypothetical protein
VKKPQNLPDKPTLFTRLGLKLETRVSSAIYPALTITGAFMALKTWAVACASGFDFNFKAPKCWHRQTALGHTQGQ